MKIIKENVSISDWDFNAWSGAKDTLKSIFEAGTQDEFDSLIEEIYPDGLTETELNDILWFEVDWLKEMGILPNDEEEEKDKKIEEVVEKLSNLISTNTPYITSFNSVNYMFSIYEEGSNDFEQFYLDEIDFDNDIKTEILNLISNEEIYELVEAFYDEV